MSRLDADRQFPPHRVRIADQTAGSICNRARERKMLVKNVGKMHVLLDNCSRMGANIPVRNSLFPDACQASLSS